MLKGWIKKILIEHLYYFILVLTRAPVLLVVFAIFEINPQAALDCDPKAALESKATAASLAI